MNTIGPADKNNFIFEVAFIFEVILIFEIVFIFDVVFIFEVTHSFHAKGGVELRLHEAFLALIFLLFTQITLFLVIVGASG